MAVTTRRGKKTTIHPPMSSLVKGEMKKNKKLVEASEELVDKMEKEVEVSKKVVPISRPPPPFI